MRVIVTRPGPQAGQWVKALRDAGHEALALPLIAIGPAANPEPVIAAWRALGSLHAVMFVSANAVEHFFALRPADCVAEPSRVRYWATGPGTVAALLAQGVARDAIDAPDANAGQFDSEALWAVVQATVPAGARVLIVRGDSSESGEPEEAQGGKGVGRDWLAAQLTNRQARVDFVVSYARRAPVLQANALALVQVAAADGSVWLFSSSEAVANLQAVAVGVRWSRALAIATHARIAQAAREAGFETVREARPVMADLLASIESLP